MEWTNDAYGVHILTAFSGSFELCRLYQIDNTFKLNLNEATLAASTLTEAKAEALDIVQADIEDKCAFFDELSSLFSEI